MSFNASLDSRSKLAPLEYSFGGVVEFLQHQWLTFENERLTWKSKESELVAKVQQLENQISGGDKLRDDLLRRIKMLEFALREERTRVGTRPAQDNIKYESLVPVQQMEAQREPGAKKPDNRLREFNELKTRFTRNRNMLRKYLSDLGAEAEVIRASSTPSPSPSATPRKKVSALFSHEAPRFFPRPSFPKSGAHPPSPSIVAQRKDVGRGPAGDEISGYPPEEYMPEVKLPPPTEGNPAEPTSPLSRIRGDVKRVVELPDVRAAVPSEEEDQVKIADSDEDDSRAAKMEWAAALRNHTNREEPAPDPSLDFAFGGPISKQMARKLGIAQPGANKSPTKEPISKMQPFLSDSQKLGELARIGKDLAKSQEAESLAPVRKLWKSTHVLRGHLDTVRCLKFHEQDPILLSGSDDGVVRMWSLRPLIPSTKNTSSNLEPLFNFRGHKGPVLALDMRSQGRVFCSGGYDGTVRLWSLPDSNFAPYGAMKSVTARQLCILTEHEDAVWSVCFHPYQELMISASADKVLRIWNVADPHKAYCISEARIPQQGEEENETITAVSVVHTSAHSLAVGCASGRVYKMDIETGEIVAHLSSQQSQGGVYAISTHPTLPLAVTAHSDGTMCFFDLKTRAMCHTLPAHTDAVTTLDFDPCGSYVASGSHDSSIRLWDIANYSCVQEIYGHRSKNGEAVNTVAYHQTKSFFASGGGDSVVKLYR